MTTARDLTSRNSSGSFCIAWYVVTVCVETAYSVLYPGLDGGRVGEGRSPLPESPLHRNRRTSSTSAAKAKAVAVANRMPALRMRSRSDAMRMENLTCICISTSNNLYFWAMPAVAPPGELGGRLNLNQARQFARRGAKQSGTSHVR
jgi:hypothetical protein